MGRLPPQRFVNCGAPPPLGACNAGIVMQTFPRLCSW